MRQALEAFSGLLLVMIGFGSIFSYLALWAAAKITKVTALKFGRIAVCSVITTFITYFAAFLFSALPFLGSISAFILSSAGSLLLIKCFMRVSLKKAVGYWSIYITAQIISIILSVECLTGGITYFLDII